MLAPKITDEFRLRRARFESLFPGAYEFLTRLEQDGPRHGLWLSTTVNAHLYKGGCFLAYLKVRHPGFDQPVLQVSRQYNRCIADGARDCSHALFPEPFESVVGHGEREGWLVPRSGGSYDMTWNTPTPVFFDLYDVLVALPVG